MKCEDLSTEHILKILSKFQGQWAFWHDATDSADYISFRVDTGIGSFEQPIKIFEGKVIPRKLMLRKWEKLIKKGLIGGCECGCRGDFEITDLGLKLINVERTKNYTGY